MALCASSSSRALLPSCSTRIHRCGTVFKPATSNPGSRCLHVAGASKGFGSTETPSQDKASSTENNQGAPSTSAASQDSTIDALEARMRSRRAKRVEAKVKVESAAVDAVTGKGPAAPNAGAETAFVTGLTFLFTAVILQGLLVAGSGFLPEEWDAFVSDVLYPGYTPTVVAFLAGSSVYGLWKIGKLPLPFLGAPPPETKE